MRKLPIAHALTLAAVLLGSATPAAAAPPGQFAISVERLFGFSQVKTETDLGGTTFESTITSISFLGTPLLGPAYSSPRLGFDYLHESGLSIGIAASYQQLSVEAEGEVGTDESNDLSVFVVAPRVGYFVRASPEFGVWPRAGVTYRVISPDGGGESSATAVTAELALEYLAAEHVGLSAMPHLDFGVAGSAGSGSDSIDQTATEFGLQFGLSLFF